jgi:DnaJ-class molecular chaperone
MSENYDCLDKSKKIIEKCKKCDGTGKIKDLMGARCDACNGTGEIENGID